MVTPQKIDELKLVAAKWLKIAERVGRNEPCYCGSGKKYKSCHASIDHAQEEERRQWDMAASFLRRDLIQFARDTRFHESFAQALPFYWNNFYDAENSEQMSPPETIRFFDWFAFDYLLPDGKRLIELYQTEKGGELSSYQQKVLAAWMEAMPASAYHLFDYDGQILYLQELVTQQNYVVYEPGGHGETEEGDIILARIVPVNDRYEFSSTAAYIPEDERADLMQKLEVAHAAYFNEHPQATLADFLRANGHIPIHHALAQAELKGRPPVDRLNPNREEVAAQKMARRLRSMQRKLR